MKKIILLTFAILVVTTINSCKKDKEQEPKPATNKGVTAEKTDVKTYEIVNLIAHVNLVDKYNATFGSAAIELLKTSDSTLTFYVPDIAEGEVLLRFDLATIKFKVTKTAEVNANQLITNLTQNFDMQVSLLNPSTTDEIAEVNSLNQYKQEVISLFNSLTDDEKLQAILFYEANKEIFKSFANSTFTNLNTSTAMRLQSECPRTDFKSYYGCTAENLGNAAIGLKNASKEFLKMLALAGASAYLAPASFGLSAFGTTLALGTAGYLLITEVRPAALHFKHSLFPFLNANWIFSKALFQATGEVFQDQISTSLNLTPKFRSLTANDGNVNSGSGYFISAMTSLSGYWNKLTSIFGNFPTYKNTEESTTLATNEISISNISNSKVQYLGNTGQSVKFKSLSGNEESFSYNIRVSKEGFIEEKTLTGKVLAVIDSTYIYESAVVGNWTMTWNNGEINKFTFKTGGSGIYYWMQCSSCAEGNNIEPENPVYRITWSIRKVTTGVWYLDFNYPDRGWSSSTQIFLTPSIHSGVPIDGGLYFLGVKD
ncbi:MAG: hypothetical protein NVV82_12130 [Sporocytophaga sp.]|nr:hypothetical protein [Sporocytophaga sp.]